MSTRKCSQLTWALRGSKGGAHILYKRACHLPADDLFTSICYSWKLSACFALLL